MRSLRRHRVTFLIATTALLVLTAGSAAANSTTINPSDPRLVPNPIESSDLGTAWSCRATGSDVQCDGALSISWDLTDGPGDWCAVPLYSINGTFTRTQTRYYSYDAATGDYLEVKRLIHLSSNESLTPLADPSSTNVVTGWLTMTWITTFGTPGDLDSRVTQKQGIDTFLKPPNTGVLVLDVGQKMTTSQGDDFDFKGRWDIALGDPTVEFGKVCTALGV
jgi:hypothetical protein